MNKVCRGIIIVILVVSCICLCFNKMSYVNASENTEIENVDEYEKYIEDIKNEYLFDKKEDILTLERLYKELDKYSYRTEEVLDQCLARSERTVIDLFFYNELVSGLEDAETIVNTIEEKGKVELLKNDTYYIKKTVANDYGTVRICEIVDEPENVNCTKGWTPVKSDSETVTKEYGDRKYTIKYTTGNKICKASYVMIMGYTLNASGIQERYLKTEGTSITAPKFSIEIKESYYTDDVATHEGADINARVIYKLKSPSLPTPLPFPFTGTLVSSEHKIEGTVKLLKWNKEKKNMQLEQKYTVYSSETKIY